MDVSDRRMQVQLTRKFCLRQNLSPRATGFVDPEGLGKSTCRKQKSSLISILSGRFLRLWALSTVWGPGVFPAPFCSLPFRLRPTPYRRECASASPLSPVTGTARCASRRCGKGEGTGWRRVCRVHRSAAARGKCGRKNARAAKTQSKRPWAETLRCHSLCAVVSFSYAAGVCAGAVGVALASGEAPGDAMRMGVMTSPPRTPKLSVSGKR